MRIVSRDEIEAALDKEEAMAAIADGFRAFSRGEAQLSAVGHLRFAEADGDCHIKGGYIRGDDFFVVKLATGFYRNPLAGLPSSNGFMAVLSAKTGKALGLLLDEGRLTDVRTAMAGAIAARRILRPGSRRLGVLGTGIQGELQARFVAEACELQTLRIWGRNAAAADALADRLREQGLDAAATPDVATVCQECDLVVTATPSTEPLIMADMVKPGLRIVAVGADAPGKCELDPLLLERAEMIVVDSRDQCLSQGEVQHVFGKGRLDAANLIELGTLLETDEPVGRGQSIVIADLTGLGVQDLQIAKSVWKRLPVA